MKIFYSLYTLQSQKFGQREGALLKVEFSPVHTGYADCHPWYHPCCNPLHHSSAFIESSNRNNLKNNLLNPASLNSSMTLFGDQPLKEQLSLLKMGRLTPLTSQSMSFAHLDAEARAEQRNLLEDLEIPDSHFLLQSFDSRLIEKSFNEGFKLFKIKAKDQDFNAFQAIIPLLEKLNVQIRVDFNSCLSTSQYLNWQASLEGKEFIIDFFEDPRNPDDRQEIKKTLSWAADFNPYTPSTDIRIVKPAVESIAIDSYSKIVVTSYLDHPLGQVTAAYVAGKFFKTYPFKLKPCGLLSHRVYEKNVFSELLTQRGPIFSKPEGTGFGFDEQLAKQRWVSL